MYTHITSFYKNGKKHREYGYDKFKRPVGIWWKWSDQGSLIERITYNRFNEAAGTYISYNYAGKIGKVYKKIVKESNSIREEIDYGKYKSVTFRRNKILTYWYHMKTMKGSWVYHGHYCEVIDERLSKEYNRSWFRKIYLKRYNCDRRVGKGTIFDTHHYVYAVDNYNKRGQKHGLQILFRKKNVYFLNGVKLNGGANEFYEFDSRSRDLRERLEYMLCNN